MADSITLRMPTDDGFERVANLVLGGLAARLGLTFEHLEDLQLALDGLLGCADEAGGDVTVTIVVDESVLRTRVGPFAADALAELERDDASLGLRRVLDTVCDGYELDERDDGRWIELTKRVEPAGTTG